MKKQKSATRRAEDCHWSLPGGFTRPGSAQLDGQEGRVQPGPTQHQVITSNNSISIIFQASVGNEGEGGDEAAVARLLSPGQHHQQHLTPATR